MILYKYISREFVKFFLVTLIGFLLIFVLVDFLDRNERDFVRYNATLTMIIKYYIYSIPQKIIMFSPLAVLLSVMISLILLNRNSEIIAMRACGMSISRIVRPFIFISFGIVLTNLFIMNSVVPKTETRLKRVDQIEIRKKAEHGIMHDKNWFRDATSYFHIEKFKNKNTELYGISVYRFDDDFLLSQKEDAVSGLYNPLTDTWMLSDVTIRRYSKNGFLKERLTEPQIEIRLPAKPKDLTYEEKGHDQMGYRELAKFIEQGTQEGIDVSDLKVELYLKIAFPFISLIMCLLGIPFALTRERSGNMAVGVIVTITIGLIYWFFLSIFRALGKNQELPPFLAAWLANLVFLLVGFVLIRRVKD